jgi:type I restriction enzyme, S subunit
MRYKPYPRYKDSGIPWLGVVPVDWKVESIKRLLSVHKGINHEKNPIVLSVTLNGIIIKDIESGEGQLANSYAHYNPVSTNNIVLNPMDLISGFVGKPPISGVVSPAYISITVPDNCDIDYYVYLLQKLYYEKILFPYGKGVSYDFRWTINNETFFNLPTLYPPLKEQLIIATYLDKTTAIIDTLIAKQAKLIELLKEKRNVVISEAVARGIDNTIPMKDSGVEWLGEIPEHWTAPQMARVLLRMEQGKSPECNNNVAELNEWGVLKTSCVNNGLYNSEANKTLPSSIEPFSQYEVKENDVIMSRASGSVNLIGSVAYVYHTRPKILLSDKIFRLHLDSSVNRIFFTYLMGSFYMRTNIKMAISGGEGMANNISKGSITKFKVALPPIEEQKRIVDSIEERILIMDGLLANASKSIDLLKEKRAALISSAVTGKIDLREAV